MKLRKKTVVLFLVAFTLKSFALVDSKDSLNSPKSLSDFYVMIKKDSLNISSKKEYFTKFREVFGSSYKQILILDKEGHYPELDTLYTILNIAENLSNFDRVRWANVKFILGDESEAAKIYANSTDEKYKYIVQNSFKVNLKNSKSQKSGVAALETYVNVLNDKKKLTNELLKWAIDIAFEFEFYDLEMKFIGNFIADKSIQSKLFLNSAKKKFQKAKTNTAKLSALKTYQISENTDEKQQAAGVIYQSYLVEQKLDSAVAWLGKTKISRLSHIKDAIVLCQLTGNLESENRLFSMIPEGFIKDTLQMRKLIFEGKFSEAKILIEKSEKKFPTKNYEILLFKVRVALFNDDYTDIKEAINLIDIKNIDSYSMQSAELLKIKVVSEKLKEYPKAISIYGRIYLYEYTNGNSLLPGKMIFCEFPNTVAELLKSKLATIYLNQNRVLLAKKIIESCSDTLVSAELKYIKGVCADRVGDRDMAVKIFDDIMLSNPTNSFSQKARIYFLKDN